MRVISLTSIAKLTPFFFLVFLFSACQTVSFKEVYNGHSSEGYHARGIAVNDSTAYLSGAKGKVTIFNLTTYAVVDSFSLPASDFRGVQFTTPNHLILMNAGNDGIVYRYHIATGRADTVLYQEGAFYDAIAINRNGKGYLMGDPFNGQFLVYYTKDFGQTWERELDLPQPLKGEAGFAASNTGISLVDNTVYFATGAADTARLFTKTLGKKDWHTIPTPMPSRESYGIYSCYFLSEKEGFIAGGSYVDKEDKDSVVFYTKNSGETWENRSTGLPGYISCITSDVNGEIIVATGRLGAYFSTNKGKTWQVLTKQPFYTAVILGDKIVLSGKEGTMAIFLKTQ